MKNWILHALCVPEVYFQEHPAREADPIATGLISSLNIIVANVAILNLEADRYSTKSLKWINKVIMSIVSSAMTLGVREERENGLE